MKKLTNQPFILSCAFAILLQVISPLVGLCQNDDKKPRRIQKLVIPIAGYTPETGFGAGFSAIGQFKTAANDSLTPYSTIQLTAGASLNGQWVFAIPFDLYFKSRLHHCSGEISAQKSNLRFFGVGHLPENRSSERFEALLLRARAQYLKKLDPHLFAGFRWWIEQFEVTESTTNGKLYQGLVAGSERHTTSGPGLQVLVDDRDQIYYPEKGHYLELVAHDQKRHWGSDYNYFRYRFDARKFQRIGRRQVLATMLFGDFIRGQVPFFQMPQIGSLKRMRGYYEGKYRDYNLVLAQVEDRIRFHKLFALAFFGSIAYMNNAHFDLQKPGWHGAGGLGLRYFWNTSSRTTLRLDVAFGTGKPLFYLAVGEAF